MAKVAFKKVNLMVMGSLLTIVACKKTNTGSNGGNAPELELTSISSHTINSSDTAAWTAYFTFSDKDGDIGTDPDYLKMAFYIIDARYPTRPYPYPFPYLPTTDFPDGKKSGYLSVRLNPTIYFLPRSDSAHSIPHRDTTYLSFVLKDTSGNVSDTVRTDALYIY